MKAAVFYEKNNIKIEDIEKPNPKSGEVLIKVRSCGICGTDVHIFGGDEGAAKTPPETVLGHEFSGEVAALGEGVTGFKIGDRVCVDPNKLCGSCEYCTGGEGHFCTSMTGIGTTVNGGFEEYCAVPQSQVYRFGNELSFAEAAMTEPVSCCLHGIDMCNIKSGSTVAVIGCGMIGLIMLQLSLLNGAARVIAIEPVAEKREQALKLGAYAAFDPTDGDLGAALKAAGIHRIETVIECVGRTSAIEQAISIAGNNSTVMMFGLTAPADTISVKPFEIFKKEIVLKSSFINPYTFGRALALLSSGRLDVSSFVYKSDAPLEQLPEILANADERRKGKIIISCSK